MSNPNFPQNLDIHPSSSSLITDNDQILTLYGHTSQQTAIQRYGIAGRVWEAAYALNYYLDGVPRSHIFDPPFRQAGDGGDLRMIELGSGSGMIGINIARSLRSRQDLLILTDLPEVCPLLESNLNSEFNGSILREPVTVRPLAWGDSEHASVIRSELLTDRTSGTPTPLSHIICSDLVYFPELLAPLLRSLIELSSPSFARPNLRVIISYKIRSLAKETPFWSAFGLWFSFEPVLAKNNCTDGSQSSWQRFGSALEGPVFIFVAHRRPESLSWTVALDDRDLLAGVGVHGTSHPKADDTFETLLFMSLDDENS